MSSRQNFIEEMKEYIQTKDFPNCNNVFAENSLTQISRNDAKMKKFIPYAIVLMADVQKQKFDVGIICSKLSKEYKELIKDAKMFVNQIKFDFTPHDGSPKITVTKHHFSNNLYVYTDILQITESEIKKHVNQNGMNFFIKDNSRR